jgi:hypothetical protein
MEMESNALYLDWLGRTGWEIDLWDTGLAHLWSLLAGKTKLLVLYLWMAKEDRGCGGEGKREEDTFSCVAWRLLPSIRSGFIWDSAVFVLVEVDMCTYPVFETWT